MTDKSKTIFAKATAFFAAIVWGSSFFVVKNTVDSVPPAYLLAMRFTIGALVLFALFHRRLRGIRKNDVFRGVIIGVFLYLASYVQVLGLTGTTPGKNAFLTAVYCVLVPFLYWIARRRRPSGKSFLAAAVLMAGVGLVSLTDNFTIEPGDLLTLASGLLFAVHIVSIAMLGNRMDPLALTILQFATMAALCWITGLCFETFPARVSGAAALTILYLGLVPTTLGFLSQVVAQKYASPESTALILSLESVFGALFSVIFYGEELTVRGTVGFLTIFLAILISEADIGRIIRRGRGREAEV